MQRTRIMLAALVVVLAGCSTVPNDIRVAMAACDAEVTTANHSQAAIFFAPVHGYLNDVKRPQFIACMAKRGFEPAGPCKEGMPMACKFMHQF